MSHNTTICLGCANIFNVSVADDNIECPKCKLSIDPEEYNVILDFAKYVVYYGVSYRSIYEKQLEENDEIRIHYALLDPATIFTFICLAALSGIIGGASYDLVKKVIKMIKSQEKKLGEQQDVTDDDVSKIITYSYEFLSGMEDVDERVRYEVYNEIHTWKITYEMTDKVKDSEKLKELNKELDNSSGKIEYDYKVLKRFPSPEDFNKLWKKIK